jgi:hypothetical protein
MALKQGQIVSMRPAGRLVDAHSYLDEMIADEATGIVVLVIRERGEDAKDGTRTYSYQEFGRSFAADRLLITRVYEQEMMDDLMDDED